MIFPTKEGEWILPESKVDEWKESYPTKDIGNELIRARQWLRDNPQRQKKKRGMTRYLGSWIARSEDMKAPVKNNDHKRNHFNATLKNWLEQKPTLLEMTSNGTFMALIQDPDTRKMAEEVYGLVREI